MYSTAVCPFCLRAEMLLNSKGVTEIEKIRVDLDSRQREEMMNKTGRRTVPQIYIGDTHVADSRNLRRSNTPESSTRCSRPSLRAPLQPLSEH